MKLLYFTIEMRNRADCTTVASFVPNIQIYGNIDWRVMHVSNQLEHTFDLI